MSLSSSSVVLTLSDIDSIPEDHILVLNLNEDENRERSVLDEYDDVIVRFRVLCTEGGSFIKGKRSTYEGAKHKVFTVNLVYMEDGIDYSTRLLIVKSDAYTIGFVRNGEWQIATGHHYTVSDAKSEIRLTYGGSNEDPFLGRSIIIEALKNLKHNNNPKKALDDMARHFSESARFESIFQLVRGTMLIPHDTTKVVFNKELQELVKRWQALSNIWMHIARGNTYKIPHGLGIANEEDLKRTLAILLREDPSIRDVRTLRRSSLKVKASPKGVKEHPLKITSAELELVQEVFWNKIKVTVAEHEDQVWKDNWCALEAASRADGLLRTLILHHTDITVLNTSMTLFIDDKGREYKLPREAFTKPGDLRK